MAKSNNNNNNNKKNGVVELWGHEFKKAAEGLDKSEVVSFVDELVKENEALLKRAEHLSSLTKLAEQTIVEADDVAKQVQSEAEEQARTEAKAILAEAEQQAQKIIEEKRAEALARVNREVEAIKTKAQQQAETMLEEKMGEVQNELRKSIKSLYGELLSQLEGLKQQVVALEEELDQKLPHPPEKTSVVEAKSSAVEAKSNAVEAKSSAVEEKTSAVEETSQANNEFLELLQPASETGEEKPEWELEILPPIDLTQILEIINYLDNLPEVKQTELIPQIDQPTITVFLSEPIYLIDVLKELPQVSQITEDKVASNGTDVKPRKAHIELSRKIASTPSN